MIIESKLVETYLSKKKYNYGLVVSVFFLTACIVTSLFYWNESQQISSYLSANPQSVFKDKEYWRLITTLFAHGGIEHLLSNSLMLFFLTYFVTSFYGYFISIPLSIIMGALVNLFVLLAFKQNTTLVGISGVIYYLWGLWFVLYLFIDETITFTRRLVKVFAIFFILLVPTSYSPTTSYLAHYIGFAVGVLTGLGLYPFFKGRLSFYKKWEYKISEELEEMKFEEEAERLPE
jgi:rhomboid protease GluP